MNSFNFIPEGWSKDIVSLNNEEELQKYVENKEVLQGIVENCDENFNLHVSLGKGINGIIPISEVEGININKDGLPKKNLASGKVHKYVQFKIKGFNDNNELILSRKEVNDYRLKSNDFSYAGE